MNYDKQTKRTTMHQVNMSRSDLLSYLNLLSYLKNETGLPKLPNNARCYVRVPGGGGRANTDLDVDEADGGIIVTWMEESHE